MFYDGVLGPADRQKNCKNKPVVSEKVIFGLSCCFTVATPSLLYWFSVDAYKPGGYGDDSESDPPEEAKGPVVARGRCFEKRVFHGLKKLSKE
ncbi:MAG: hypothetical protein DSY99_03635, partial [Candidatus Neomarinimicrobiota bacterium]